MFRNMKNALYKSLFKAFKKAETHRHPLNYLFWECTLRCNLNCLHCGSDCTADSRIPDMPAEDFLNVLDSIPKPSDLFTVVITGGEPLMRKDLEACGRAIRRRGFRWGMVSNGIFYDEKRHNSLLNAGLGSLTFSLDGFEHSHNWLRNSPAAFRKTERAIELAVSAKRLTFDIVTCVNQKNFDELEALYAFLLDKDVKAWRLFTITPIGRAKNYDELFLTDNQMRSLMDFIIEKRKEKRIDVKFSCEGYVGAYENKVRDGFFFCRAGINIGSVLIDGSVSACPNIDRSFAQGNIYQDDFWELWQNRFKPFRGRSWTQKGECADCSKYSECRGNGMHYWHGDKQNVLQCHYKQILGTQTAGHTI